MKPFDVRGDNTGKSIGIDSSTRSQSKGKSSTATVIVSCESRADEFEILEKISQAARQHDITDFRLFGSKSHNISPNDNADFYQDIIRENADRMFGYQHTTYGRSDSNEIEAVHTALLVDDLLAPREDRLVIVDGNEQKAKPVVKSLTGLRDTLPSISHCIKAETYYPQSLLADLTASYVSYLLTSESYDYQDPYFAAPDAESREGERWSKAYHSMKQSETGYVPSNSVQYRGKSPKERAKCWFHGGMAQNGAPVPASDSLNTIIKYADQQGHTNLKAELERIR